jgi:hypothetical protein
MMSKKGLILIIFAWGMEIVGVTCGLINSAYTTFGENLPQTIVGYLPAIPMVALASAELGRVPLAAVLYQRHTVAQGLAIVGVAVLGYLAMENWTFGFERIVDLRLKAVNAAGRDLARAEADVAALKDEREQTKTTNGEKREELRRGIAQRETALAELTGQLAREAETHQQKLAQIREACRIVRERCMVPRSQDEDKRYATEERRLNAELERQRHERNELQSQIESLVTKDRTELAELDGKITTATDVVNDRRQVRRSTVEGNQIYRLAASWYGVNASEVTPEQFSTARLVFSTFSAIAVAFAGSVAALVYYARNRVPTDRSMLVTLMTKATRARRAYYARRRKPIVREVPGPERLVYRDGKEPPIVIEREVPRLIDRIVLIPRWGIRDPIYVNSLIRRGERTTQSNLIGDRANVTPLV